MTKGTFGDSLRREREMRGVSLDEISSATRIATRFLQAIENEQWEQLPGGVFNRGFVRAVARYLGLDEENIVAEYALAVDDRPSVPVWTGRPPAVVPDQPWLAWIVSAVVILLLLAGAWFGARRILAWRAARRAARSMTSIAAPSPSPVAKPDLPAAAAPAAAAQASAADPVSPPATSPAAGPTTTPTPPTAPESASTSSATSPNVPAMELKIETVKKTKVTVSGDAKRLFGGTLKAGDIQTFSARDKFQVSARDAGALVLQLNGKTLAPIGPLGHAGKITLSREALKGAGGGEN